MADARVLSIDDLLDRLLGQFGIAQGSAQGQNRTIGSMSRVADLVMALQSFRAVHSTALPLSRISRTRPGLLIDAATEVINTLKADLQLVGVRNATVSLTDGKLVVSGPDLASSRDGVARIVQKYDEGGVTIVVSGS